MDDKYIDRNSFAAFLTSKGIPTSPKQAWRLMTRDDFPRVEIGRKFFVRETAASEYLRSLEEPAPARGGQRRRG